MAQSKTEIFTNEEVSLSEIAKALSHPARIKILKVLAKKNVCMCGELVDVLPLAQSTVSQHLNELKKAGLIEGEIEGPKICYCINYKTFNKIIKSFDKLFTTISNSKCC